MNNSPFQHRASRLRAAIKQARGHNAHVSKPIEPVAKKDECKKFYQTSALFDPVKITVFQTPHASFQPLSLHFHIDQLVNSLSTMDDRLHAPTVFSSNPNALSAAQRLLDFDSNEGSLILVTGLAGNGKTTLVHTLIKDHCERFPYNIAYVRHVGPLEILYPLNASVMDTETLNYREPVRAGHNFMVVDEPMRSETAYQALWMASHGYKVIMVIHGDSCDNAMMRLYGLLAACPDIQDIESRRMLYDMIERNRLQVICHRLMVRRTLAVKLDASSLNDFDSNIQSALCRNPDHIVILYSDEKSKKISSINAEKLRYIGYSADILSLSDQKQIPLNCIVH